jgi:hypothetical protein
MLSDGAMRKAVVVKGLTHPLTTFPLAAATLSGAALLILTNPPVAILVWVAAITGTVGLGNWGLRSTIGNVEAQKEHIAEVKQRIAEINEQKRFRVGPLLEKHRDDPALRELVERGLEQFRQIGESFPSFMRVLDRKLDKNELTYGVFFHPGEQTTLNVYDGLEEIATKLEAIRSINAERLSRQIQSLEAQGDSLPPDEVSVLASLRKRKKTFDEQVELIRSLLQYNTEAITQLEMTTAKVSEMTVGERHASAGREAALAELLRMAQRTSLYGKDRQP